MKRVGKLAVFGAPIHATSPAGHSEEDPERNPPFQGFSFRNTNKTD